MVEIIREDLQHPGQRRADNNGQTIIMKGLKYPTC